MISIGIAVPITALASTTSVRFRFTAQFALIDMAAFMTLDASVLNDILISIMDKRQVTILLYDGLHLVDVAGPSEAMRHALRFVSVDGGPVRAQCGLQVMAA